jgi:hypothetical protein
MAVLRIEAGLLREGRPALRIAQRGDRLLWEPPEGLRLEDAERDVTALLDGRVHVGLRSQDDETEWMVPTRSTTELPRARKRNPVVTAAARIDAGVAAAGAPLPLGRYDVRVHLSLASFSRNGAARAEGEPLTITVSPAGHVSVSLRGTRVSRWLARGARPLARAARKAWRRASTAGRS